MARAQEFKRIGVDAVFVEALPDRAAMTKVVKELNMPLFANSKFEAPNVRNAINLPHDSH